MMNEGRSQSAGRAGARRWPVLVASVAVVLGALIGPASAAAGPNDTMAGAEGPVTGSFTAAIDTENDVDWYFMYALGSTQLDAAITGLGPEESCFDWYTVLRDSDGHALSSSTVYFNRVSHIRYTLPTSGTYYLEVSGGLCSNVGYYRIDLAASPALLTSPPYIPPPPSSGSQQEVSLGCRAAQRRVAILRSRLRHATSRRQRNRLRAKLRQARSRAASLC